MKTYYLKPNENLTIRTADCTNALKQTIRIEDAAGSILYNITFNNDGSLYEFSQGEVLQSARLKIVGIDSFESSCAIHVSGVFCPICKKQIE